MTTYGLNIEGLGIDTRQARLRRAAFGALYGLLVGTVFVWVAAYIDVWLHPDLPLGVNWSAFMQRLPLIGLGLALVGAVTCWWHEAWQGLLGGALTASALALIAALVSSQAGTGMKFIVLVFILMPVAAMTLPVAYFLRWITERHARAARAKSNLQIVGLVALAIAVGAGLGFFMKASNRGVEATRFIHGFLQDLDAEKNPLVGVAGVSERRDKPYVMYPTTSLESTEGFKIHVEYEDGHRMQCDVILYPGRIPFFAGCAGE